MVRAITIATNNYITNLARLIRSFIKFNPGSDFTVYVEDSKWESFLSGLGARSRVFPEIKTLGVKRAKFLMYVDALKEGGFLYLDSDIIVLDSLADLRDSRQLVACRDELTMCSFIENKKNPWPSRPDLSSEKYFNSGVFFAPDHQKEFFESCAKAATDDEQWSLFTVPGYLYDNHFVCAMAAESNLPIRWVSGLDYNWQGFYNNGALQVKPRDGNLINRETGRKLKLVHLAGIQDIDRFLLDLPEDILYILYEATSGLPEDILTVVGGRLWRNSKPEHHVKIQLLKSTFDIVNPEDVPDPAFVGTEAPSITGATQVLSIATSVAPSDVLWNGLRCGGPYLSPREYVSIRRFLRLADIASILEIGAGYTSMLFKQEVQNVLSIEAIPGAWLDLAVAHGCNAKLIPFSERCGGFEPSLLLQVLDANNFRKPDLIFLDSPNGTRDRDSVMHQLLSIAKPDYVAVHDAKRDSKITFWLESEHGFRVCWFEDSLRGLIVLGKNKKMPGSGKSGHIPRVKYPLHTLSCLIEPVHSDSTYTNSSSKHIFLRLKNTGSAVLPFLSDTNFRLSYHIFDRYEKLISWENRRFQLPCDLFPEDVLQFQIALDDTTICPDRFIQFDLVRENEFWLSNLNDKQLPLLECSAFINDVR